MIRTTPSLVAGIIEVDTSIVLDPFISAASSLVDLIQKRAEAVEPDDSDLLNRLTLIETWLSAHFYCIRDPRTIRERAGPVDEYFESKVDLNLYISRYGQMAIVLDTSGLLRELSVKDKRRVVAGVTWLGTEDE